MLAASRSVTPEDQNRREYFRWDFVAHWRTDCLALVFICAGAYTLFVVNSVLGAMAWGAFVAILLALPRSNVWARFPFGGGVGARKSAKLPTDAILKSPPSSSEPAGDSESDEKPS